MISKKLKFAGVVAAALMMFSASIASAKTVYNEGVTSGFSVEGPVSTKKTFDDVYNFSIKGKGESVFDLLLTSFTGSFSIQLFDKKDQLVTSITPSLTSFTSLLDKGNYKLEFQGFKNSSYSGGVTISPVPEPYEWVLLAAGLGLVAGVSRKKKDRTASSL